MYNNHKNNSEEVKVDEETAKMVENLKLRLKTLDQDLERVKQAALKINDEFNLNNNNNSDKIATTTTSNNEKQDDEHLSRANSFVYDDDQNQQVPSIKPIVADLRMAEWYVSFCVIVETCHCTMGSTSLLDNACGNN